MSQYPYNHQQGYNYPRQPAPQHPQHPQQQPPPPPPHPMQPQHPQEVYDTRRQYIPPFQNSPPGPAPYPAPHYHQPTYHQPPQPSYPTHVTSQTSYGSHASYGGGAAVVESRSVDAYQQYPKAAAGPSHHMSSGAREVRAEMQYGAAQQSLQTGPHAVYSGPWTADQVRPRGEPQSDENELIKYGQRVFQDFDVDRSGYLDLHEFMEALRTARLDITYHEAIECFLRCDENEDGRITQEEFVKIFVDESKQRYTQPHPSMR